MTFWLNVRHDGAAINLPLSRAERTSARDIHNELTSVLGADAMAYSRVALYGWQRFFPTILVDPPPEKLTAGEEQ
jgi:hypothetical protein